MTRPTAARSEGPDWKLSTYRSLLSGCFSADTAKAKGDALEDFISYTFESLDGLTLLARDIRMGSQELDLVFWNDGLCEYFDSAGAEVLIECKNWESPVGSAEVAWFLEKMRQRAVTHGFFVTRNGVTGEFRDGRDGALDLLFSTLRDGLRPVVLTLDEMAAVTQPIELLALFKQKTGRLFVRRI